nr:SMI1/KNR4 family protein [uncultured Tyzzerella sp.]
MNYYFELLKKILPIPKNVYDTGNYDDWLKFEKKLGIILPNDYKDFIETYGTGSINNFIWFLTPFSEDDNINYLKRMNIMLQSYNVSKNNFPEEFIHNTYPEKNGLLPWGYTENGDEMFWLINDNIEDWLIIAYESRSSKFYSYEMSFVEFIYKLITKKLVCDIFPQDFFEEEIKYLL